MFEEFIVFLTTFALLFSVLQVFLPNIPSETKLFDDWNSFKAFILAGPKSPSIFDV